MSASHGLSSTTRSDAPAPAFRTRGFAAVGALLCVIGFASACHDDPKPQVTTESAAPTNSQDPHAGMNRRVDVPPLLSKTNAAELCVYDTYSFRDARAAYLGSLGGAEPSAAKIPDFGQMPPDGAAPSPTPATSGSGAPAAGSAGPKAPPTASAAKSAAPKASAAPPKASNAASAAPPASGAPMTEPPPAVSGKPMPDRKLTGIRYQQYTKQCQMLVNMKEPTAGDLDTAAAEYAPFATELARTLTEASMYYQQEKYKEDDFAKGKDLHKKLVEAFGKLDDLQSKMFAALKDFEQKQPIDRSGWSASQKLSNDFNTAAIAFYLDVNGPKLDWKAAKDDLAKIDAALKAMNEFKTSKDDSGKDHATDPFIRMCIGGAEQFAERAHAMFDEGKDRDHVVPAQGIALTNFVDRLLANDHNAMLQSMGASPGTFPDKMRPRIPGGRPGAPPRIRPQTPQAPSQP